MSKFSAYAIAFSGASLILPLSCPASAQEFTAAAAAKPPFPVTFVSGLGTDSAACGTEVKPCRTFKMAIGQTAAGGEIKALTPADYGPVIITKAISITGVDGAGINSTPSGGTAIAINAGAGDVLIKGLVLDGAGTASNGINLNSAASLTVTNCTIKGFGSPSLIGNGIALAGATSFAFYDTIIENSSSGILVNSASGAVNGVIKNVKMQFNLNFGFYTAGGGSSINVAIEDSVAFSNGRGIQASAGPGCAKLD